MNEVGVVIPAYNEGDRLRGVLSKVKLYVSPRNIYMIDDGSTDLTSEVASDEGVVVFKHQKNRGKGEALKSGFRLALADGMESIITLDGDGQHNPDFIPGFINTLMQTNSDVVLGMRSYHMDEMPIDRIISNGLSSLIVSAVARNWFPDSQCGYRLFRSRVIASIPLRSSRYEMETELIIKAAWQGYRITHFPIQVLYGGYHSHIRRITDTWRFCKLVMRLMGKR